MLVTGKVLWVDEQDLRRRARCDVRALGVEASLVDVADEQAELPG
jgi:hypothetical protein